MSGDRALILPSTVTPPSMRHTHGTVVAVLSDPFPNPHGELVNFIDVQIDGCFCVHETELLVPILDPDARPETEGEREGRA